MNSGLSELERANLQQVFARYPQVERVILYGSRARGDFKPGSDLDLTLYGSQLSQSMLSKIEAEIDDLLLPYKIDLSIFADIDNENLKLNIQKQGVVFFSRREDS